MTRPWTIAAAVIFAACTLQARSAEACTCAELPSPCSPGADVVIFTGRVTASEPHMDSLKNVRLTISETFRGEIAGRTATVTTQASVGTCGYPFARGEEYLVFAWKTDDGQLFTSLCTLTGPLLASRDNVELLREMKKGDVQSRLRGSVTEVVRQLDGNFNTLNYLGLAGVDVTAAGDGGRVRTTTDARGTFLFKGLPAGRYAVTAAVPPGYSLRSWRDSGVTLDSCFASTTITVIRTPLEGRVVDGDGSPVTRPVRVGAVVAGTRREPPDRRRATYVLSGADGSWRFEGLPPGRYLIGANLFEHPDDTPFQASWYRAPGREEAAVVTVSHDRVTKIDVPIGPPYERSELRGVVVDERGAPVAWASIILTDVDTFREHLFAAFADTDGRFVIPVWKGRTYDISAMRSIGIMAQFVRAPEQRVEDFTKDVRLVIPGTGAR